MNASTPPKPDLNWDEIVWRASQLWQAERRPGGRDEEYWLRAKQALRVISQPAKTGAVSLRKRASG